VLFLAIKRKRTQQDNKFVSGISPGEIRSTMTERTTVVSSGSGSGVAIVAIVVLALIVIVGLLYFTGAGASLFPSQIDVNVNPPPAQPAPQQPAPEQPQNPAPAPMSYQLSAVPNA
jgi:hypothetical protein